MLCQVELCVPWDEQEGTWARPSLGMGARHHCPVAAIGLSSCPQAIPVLVPQTPPRFSSGACLQPQRRG